MTVETELLNREKTILLVDDDHNFRFSMATELRALGHLVVCAENGERAIKMIQENMDPARSFDLVITDLVMPRKDGLRFCRDMRKMGMDLTVLVITGYMVPEVLRELVEMGCNNCLEKPFTPAELVEKIEMLFGHEGDPGQRYEC